MSIAIIYATDMEAAPLLDAVGATAAGGHDFPFYRACCHGVDLLIAVCGMGMAKARPACRALLDSDHPGQVVNAGICGALSPALRAGDIVTVGRIIHEMHGEDPMMAAPWPGLPAVGMVTVDEPVFDPRRRQTLSASGDIVEMEGWGIARECAVSEVPCTMLKAVSDDAGNEGRAALLRNLAAGSRALAIRLRCALPALERHMAGGWFGFDRIPGGRE